MILHRFSRFFYRVSSGWLTIIALFIFLSFTATVLPAQAERADAYSGDAGSPDGSFFYTPGDLYEQAEAYGEDGRAAYVRARWTFDVVWPLVYAFFLVTGISFALGRALPPDSGWRLLNLTPIAGALLDFLENSAASVVMVRFPDKIAAAAWLAALFTPLKWVFVNGSFVVLIAGLLLLAVHAARRRQ